MLQLHELLSLNPAIVLADEPTANLDSVTGAKILQVMRRMNEEHQTTFIFSTHDPEVLEYAKRKILMRDGVIVSANGDASLA